MDIGSAIALVGVVFVGIALLATWQRNGRHQRDRDIAQAEKLVQWKTEIQLEVKHIKDELTSEDHGLIALVKGQAEFRNHCTEVSGKLMASTEANAGAIASNTKLIDEINRQRRKKGG